ncbi:MAG TPA: DUF4342 domain-containing protein [Ktedonobacteraceae bacterium]|nr:DUF4342 domain-containing protein [Ktedonobacteraceae bacterium]
MITQVEPKTFREELRVTGETLLTAVKKLAHEGNVRRIIIKQGEHVVVELPLTVGVISVVLTPMLAAIGAISALLADCTIEVERIEPPVEVKVP